MAGFAALYPPYQRMAALCLTSKLQKENRC
jgi:hypothetical protein